jgi:hypothetical protein
VADGGGLVVIVVCGEGVLAGAVGVGDCTG